ncbi:MAG: FAD-binding oxidoreductase [Halolamina sp.]|uniref:NAD(P)/FAD-dependent oxidoreductase n=1 Tax=Halolamina sp. TaxID=1940283 RepID=UPI002FC3072E
MTDDTAAAVDPATALERTYDLAIVGGGVIGCAAANALAPDHDVLVVEKGQVAGEATALAAGEVTMTPSYSDSPEVATHANEFFHEFDGTREFSYEPRPSLELVRPGQAAVARRRVDRLRGEGIDIEFLDAEAVAAAAARLRTDDIAGAVKHDETGFVDPYTFAVTLRAEAEAAGATVLTGTAVEELSVQGGTEKAVSGLVTEAGAVRADRVLVAAGWRSERFLRDYLELPVQPYRTQCLVLDPAEPLSESFPMGWIPGEHVYFRPELNGDLLVGGWSFAEETPEDASGQADEAFRQHVAGLLPRFFEGFDRAGYVDGWAGVDGATPDTRPIIDAPAAGPANLLVATGFHGRGVMTAPVAATLVRALVTGEDTELPAQLFALDRFESTSPDFEFTSISAGDDEYEGE